MSQDKKVDPGWNDPPMLNYSPNNPPPKSRITNKRVAFPIASNSGQSASLSSSAPPPMCSLPPPDPFVNINKLIEENSDNEDLKNNLELIKKSWEYYSNNVKGLMGDLLLSLCEKNAVKSNELVLKLSLKYPELSGPWLGSVKLLISNMQ